MLDEIKITFHTRIVKILEANFLNFKIENFRILNKIFQIKEIRVTSLKSRTKMFSLFFPDLHH